MHMPHKQVFEHVLECLAARHGAFTCHMRRCRCRGSVSLHNVTINSTDLDFVSCPSSNTTLRIGQNLTCNGTYVVKEWDLQRPSLYFNVYGDSSTLRPDRWPSMGPTAMLHMLATSQLHLDVLAHTCHRTPASELLSLDAAACWCFVWS